MRPKCVDITSFVAVLCGPASNITKLRTTSPLFKAYEETFTTLESICPAFYKSEQFFTYLLGKRVQDQSEGPKTRYVTVGNSFDSCVCIDSMYISTTSTSFLLCVFRHL